jgi:hypothetical protein
MGIETPNGIEGVSDLNARPGAQDEENLIIRDLFQAVTGRKLDCGCSKKRGR